LHKRERHLATTLSREIGHQLHFGFWRGALTTKSLELANSSGGNHFKYTSARATHGISDGRQLLIGSKSSGHGRTIKSTVANRARCTKAKCARLNRFSDKLRHLT
jgi:hypothetical protein